jgi:hypothetical protein
MEPGKKKKIIIGISIGCVLLLISAHLFVFFNSSYTAIITNIDSKYYRARILFLTGDTMVCLKYSGEYEKRVPALDAAESGFNLSIVPLSDVANIEIVPDFNVTVYRQEDDDGDIQTKYLGKFKVDVAGNIGYLYLKKKDGKLHGTIRFPDWANGSYEPLKSLWISKGKIGFIRSVDTPKEARYVGVTTYFIQEYYGNYVRKGNMIEGHYTSRGVKNQWRAYRLK